jgi:drug/metabolite transporter (DMT)-like permease
MFAALALASAACYGAADFIGGMAARRADTIPVVMVSQAAGMILVALMLPLLDAPVPGRVDLLWSGAAGIAGGVGVALLYRALAVGVMSMVAPVTAVCGVVVPVVIAVVLLGERPAVPASLGIALALAAVVLISQADERPTAAPGEPEGQNPRRRGLGLALASGVSIGIFFFALARTSAAAGLWPLLIARGCSVGFFGVLALASGRALRLPRPIAATAMAGGILDMLANLLYLLATRRGPLTLVVTLSALYPASTVMLAWRVLHERLTGRQWAGVGLALGAIVLIVRG